jgi:hypothetical protein
MVLYCISGIFRYFSGSSNPTNKKNSENCFIGNKVEAYGGTISFTLGHSEYNSLGLGEQALIILIELFYGNFV